MSPRRVEAIDLRRSALGAGGFAAGEEGDARLC